ncbi:3-phosphoglycerate dehydrogenase [Thermocladium modestius]|uniref:3-phosphoglycerate dehydrogenase n=2 Tax=Thermocladium modestius TaxID=62609 RepID=A0A830GS03_9CREN|nr:3-phosphoglycerate dehydrogenase [Thermocladium modestius]
MAAMDIVLTTIPLPGEAIKYLENHGFQARMVSDMEEETMARAVALLCWCMGDLDLLSMIGKLRGLRAIQTFSAGVDHLPFNAIPPHVAVLSNAGAYSRPVAEFAWSLVLALAKGLNGTTPNRSAYISSPYSKPYLIHGKTLMVFGTRGIGGEAARIGKEGFKMRVIGINRSGAPAPGIDEVHPSTDAPRLAGRADVVIVSLPLTKETRGIIGRDFLSNMKDESILVNVGRGEVIVEEDLYEELKRRPGIRFGTDVWWNYGSGESVMKTKTGLHSLPNVLGTPHIAGGATYSDEVSREVIMSAVTNVVKFLEGRDARNLVNRSEYV